MAIDWNDLKKQTKEHKTEKAFTKNSAKTFGDFVQTSSNGKLKTSKQAEK